MSELAPPSRRVKYSAFVGVLMVLLCAFLLVSALVVAAPAEVFVYMTFMFACFALMYVNAFFPGLLWRTSRSG